MSYCANLGDKLKLAADSLFPLEEIKLAGSNISSENLAIILKSSYKLKKLDLSRCEHLLADLKLSPDSLCHLEEINLAESNISSENLAIILKSSPKLKKIDLSRCQHLGAELKLAADSLSHLEEIKLAESNISSENLDIILKSTPKLKKLNLFYCRNLGAKLKLAPESLASLEEINLSGCIISRENLDIILNSSPKLKKLNLSRCQDLSDELKLAAESLVSLEEINLGESNISSENLDIILKSSPKLKKLHLFYCRNLVADLKLSPDSLSHLEEIDLSVCTISSKNLDIILKSSPKLKKLHLSRCEHLVAELVLHPESLDCLEEINLNDSDIYGGNLKIILEAATNLRIIYLVGCKNLDEKFWLSTESIDCLEEIYLPHSNLSVENLKIILEAATNLRRINLMGSKNLHEKFFLHPGSLDCLEEIDLSDSNISVENLKIILEAAPNLSERSKKIIEELTFRAAKKDASHTAIKPNSHPGSVDAPALAAGGGASANGGGAFPSNPRHDSSKMKDFKPNKGSFQFRGKNKTKNQGMLIEKLCQYLTLKGKHLDVISKIQDGMCVALSHYFLSIEKVEWDRFVDMACVWDGSLETLDDHHLTPCFHALYANIEHYQLQPDTPAQYICDALSEFLQTNQPCILQNPWHAIAIRPTQDRKWHVYDPNDVTGCLEVTTANLLETVETAIGKVVSVVPTAKVTEIPKLEIRDANAFIEHGGLLALCQCENPEEMLSKLPQDHKYTKAALDGLLLRAISGKPAWVIGLASPNRDIIAFTQRLKTEFALMNADAVAQLTKSLDALSPIQKGECITKIIQASPCESGVESALITAICKSANQEHYEQALKTWDKTAESAPSVLKYCDDCLSGPVKRLIELDSTQQVDTLRLQLEKWAVHTSRPVFYIDNPDDLICSAPWIEKKSDNTGKLHKGPGGPLCAFLEANKDNRPLLIVNYERFTADEIVRFNGLLDKEPKADGVSLPENTQIIGLMNRNKPDCYQGSDFYSRFNHTEHCPLTAPQLEACTPQRKVKFSGQKIRNTTTINLYHSPDWEHMLLGHWVLDGDTLTFSEGELIKAIEAGKPIEIQNGNWGDKKFERFWSQVLTFGVRHGGRTVRIPEGIALVRPEQDQYAWRNKLDITEGLIFDKSVNILNPTCLGNFLGCNALEDGKLVKQPGLVEQHAGKKLIVNITRTLSDDSWAILLDECERQKVTLEVHAAPGVTFPKGFSVYVAAKAADVGLEEFKEQELVAASGVSHPKAFNVAITNGLITSTDIDTSVEMLKGNDSYTVIDVSECSPSDLLVKWDGN